MTKLILAWVKLVCLSMLLISFMLQNALAKSNLADFELTESALSVVAPKESDQGALRNELLQAKPQVASQSLYQGSSQAIPISLLPDIPLTQSTEHADSKSNSKCPFGKTMRVAVVQGGRYVDFVKIFRNMVFNLSAERYMTVNAILNDDFDFTQSNNYQQLAALSKGSCIELVPDGYYDGQWNLQLAKEQFSALKERILQQKDVDLVWAFGTLAGKFFSKQDLGVPVMVIRTTDPESAGIVGPGLYSDKPNVHAQKEIERYMSEINMFHDIFKFNSLGVVADESLELQEAQGISIIKDFALKNQVKIQLCTGPVFEDGLKNRQNTLKRCALELAKTCDAAYILVGNAESDEMSDSIQPLLDNNIPIFSQTGSFEVEHGMLMALADDSKQGSGRFEANVTKQIYHGTSPDKIPQNHYASLFLTMNLEVAKAIGWEPSFEVLVAVDNVVPYIKRRQPLH